MPRQPIVHLTDTSLAIVDVRRFIDEHPKAHGALMAWCRDHNIDPDQVPADSTITRHPVTRSITHGYRDPATRAVEERTVVVRHDVAPWPDEIVTLHNLFGGRDTELANALAEIAKLRQTVVSLRQGFRDAAAAIRPDEAGTA